VFYGVSHEYATNKREYEDRESGRDRYGESGESGVKEEYRDHGEDDAQYRAGKKRDETRVHRGGSRVVEAPEGVNAEHYGRVKYESLYDVGDRPDQGKRLSEKQGGIKESCYYVLVAGKFSEHTAPPHFHNLIECIKIKRTSI